MLKRSWTQASEPFRESRNRRIQPDTIRETEQHIAGRFGPHHKATCSTLYILTRQKNPKRLKITRRPGSILVIGVVQGTVNIKAQSTDTGQIKGH
jgi:hypothetical protein